MQLNHYNSKFSKQIFPISLVCENITNAPNIGSLFRTSDAFGIEQLFLCGEHIPLGRKMTKTSRATENAVNFLVTQDALNVVLDLKAKSYTIICLEITDSSVSLSSYEFQKDQKIALVIGNENYGISESILEISDAILHIDMFGQNSSMNVVQATSIALYEMTRQML